MNKDLYLKKIDELSKIFIEKRTVSSAETLELFLEKFLEIYPYETEFWIKLTLAVYYAPLYDDYKAITCLKKILEYEPTNVKITLLLVYVVDHCIYFDEELFGRLCRLESKDNQLKAMIEYAKSWYYFDKDEDLYQNVLKKSIEYCDQFVWNYIKLGQFYLYKNNLEEGYYYLKKGLSNIKCVYGEQHPYGDVLNVEEFFNERFKGIHLSQANYEIILDSFDQKSPWITGDFINKKKDSPTEN